MDQGNQSGCEILIQMNFQHCRSMMGMMAAGMCHLVTSISSIEASSRGVRCRHFFQAIHLLHHTSFKIGWSQDMSFIWILVARKANRLTCCGLVGTKSFRNFEQKMKYLFPKTHSGECLLWWICGEKNNSKVGNVYLCHCPSLEEKYRRSLL